ncbi:MAG TPA: 3'-5' exonuclease [Aquabacterium sp.]|nr:3'-5' exonuclease [Aquabacterium sp.]HQC96578.1 3'-5' exonuclease [Aquabacterium sp.]
MTTPTATTSQVQLRASAAVVAAVLALLALFAGVAGALLWSALPADNEGAVASALAPQRSVLVVIALAIALGAAALAQPLLRRWLIAPRQLHDAAALLVHGPQSQPLPQVGDAALLGLAVSLSALARQRDRLTADIDAAVAQASQGIAQERNRLAALMNELTQSVVVCNLDGRVLLYNPRARLQMQALAGAGAGGDSGGGLIGLGRSIHGVLDRALVTHALEAVQQRLARGEAHPSAQFVTATRGGQLLRVQLAPVRAAADATSAETGADGVAIPLAGYVLVLDNVTRSHAEDAARDRALLALTEGQRGSLANLQAAVEMLGDPDLPPPLHAQFIGVIRDEALAMGRRLNAQALPAASRWPLDDMRGADFMQAAAPAMARGVAAGALKVGLREVDETLWLQLDSFALLQALCGLAQRLHGERDVRTLHLRLQAAGDTRAHLDLVWAGHAMSTETVMGWELDPLPATAGAAPLCVRDVVQRHGGEFWFERDRVRHEAFFRFLLPRAAPVAALGAADSRPEVVDFDLFAHFGDDSDSGHALDDRPLAGLAFTVFDTETTGLQPMAGDEILQIGAVRIVNGRLLQGERYEQLVDPRRDIPAAGIPIHGITPDMVAGQPHILQVLPGFHAFAADSVLVAHNAAFDMRFLQLKEAATGLRFDQPVLDTLLLSAVVHPSADSHALDAVARRLGVAVVGRHTALGDAQVTAAVFLKLLPLLAGMGLTTLGQVRAACQQTQLARHQQGPG